MTTRHLVYKTTAGATDSHNEAREAAVTQAKIRLSSMTPSLAVVARQERGDVTLLILERASMQHAEKLAREWRLVPLEWPLPINARHSADQPTLAIEVRPAEPPLPLTLRVRGALCLGALLLGYALILLWEIVGGPRLDLFFWGIGRGSGAQ
jgi:hypothetical protein